MLDLHPHDHRLARLSLAVAAAVTLLVGWAVVSFELQAASADPAATRVSGVASHF